MTIKGLLSVTVLLSLTACTNLDQQNPQSSKQIPSKQVLSTDNPQYAIGETFKNMFINGWSNHLVLQNPEDSDGYSINYSFKTEPLNPDDINIVEFHGRKAIRLERVETAHYGKPDQLQHSTSHSALFLDPTTYRYIGANTREDDTYQQSDVVTTIYPIPKKAHIGDSGLSNEGYKADFYGNQQLGERKSTFKETWTLSAADQSTAKLCTNIIYQKVVPKGKSELNECYIINRQGDIIERDDTMIVDLETYESPRRFVTPK